jgi:vacuolar-type H+-ATPase subunit F/Vma7
MSLIAAIGDDARLAGYALSGVQVHAAGDDGAVREAWERLPDEVGCVLLTAAARAALGSRVDERAGLVWAVVPD